METSFSFFGSPYGFISGERRIRCPKEMKVGLRPIVGEQQFVDNVGIVQRLPDLLRGWEISIEGFEDMEALVDGLFEIWVPISGEKPYLYIRLERTTWSWAFFIDLSCRGRCQSNGVGIPGVLVMVDKPWVGRGLYRKALREEHRRCEEQKLERLAAIASAKQPDSVDDDGYDYYYDYYDYYEVGDDDEEE